MNKLSVDLSGKRVLVTGCGRANGIGFGIAKRFLLNGAQVLFHDVSDPEPEVAKLINNHSSAHFIKLDLMPVASGQKLLTQGLEIFGQLDILVLNASRQLLTPFLHQSPQDIDSQLRINLQSNIEMLQCVLPKMQQQGWGRVINIGSINQSNPKPVVSIYAATKAACHNLIQSLAKTYAKDNVLLNSIAPGLIDTYPENRAGDNDEQQKWQDYACQLNSIQRAGLPEEIAGAALFLASDASSFMAGETIYLTGGQYR